MQTEDKSGQLKRKKKDIGDISLEFVYEGFKAPPIHTEKQELDDLPKFLNEYGAFITNLSYIDPEESFKPHQTYRELILKQCPNINQVKFVFTEYPDEVYEGNSDMLIDFLTALAPRLTILETVNNVIGLHYTCSMNPVYENFSSKIKIVKTDGLKPDELSFLAGENMKDNPALSLEELVYSDNDYLCSRRIRQSPEALALKPASLTDLVKLTNLRRIDLPFLLTKETVPPPITPLPLINFASIRLLSNRKGKPSTSSFINNLGVVLANVKELKLCDFDPGLFVLTGLLKTCKKLEKLDLIDFLVGDDYDVGIARLADIKLTFTQLDAVIGYSSKKFSHAFYLVMHLINNVKSLTEINIGDIRDEETMDELIAAIVSSAKMIRHNVDVTLKWTRSSSESKPTKSPPANKPDNLNIIITSTDC